MRALLWLAFVGWFAVLWVLSSGPGLPTPHLGRIQWDKVLHFLYFFAGGLLLASALLATLPRVPRLALICAAAALLAIGAVDEWHQTFHPARQGGDWGDWLADSAGGIAAVLVIGWAHGKFRRRTRAAAR